MDIITRLIRSGFGSLPGGVVMQQTFGTTTVRYDGSVRTVSVCGTVYDAGFPLGLLLEADLNLGTLDCSRHDSFRGRLDRDYTLSDPTARDVYSALKKAAASFRKNCVMMTEGNVLILGYTKPRLMEAGRALADFRTAMVACSGADADRYRHSYICLKRGDNIIDGHPE